MIILPRTYATVPKYTLEIQLPKEAFTGDFELE